MGKKDLSKKDLSKKDLSKKDLRKKDLRNTYLASSLCSQLDLYLMFDDKTEIDARRSNYEHQLSSSIDSAADWLSARQKPEGYWVGRLESNSSMEAQWIMGLWFMGLDDHELTPRLAQTLRDTQQEDGAWHVYHGAPGGDINTTVEAYAALRCVGDDPQAPHMVNAREWIVAKGGLKNIRVFTRYWLALIGEWPWAKTPNLPVEVVLFPRWFPFSIYNFAQWARATLMPLAVLSARRPSRSLPVDRQLNELFPDGRDQFDYSYPQKPGADLWDAIFLTADRMLHFARGIG